MAPRITDQANAVTLLLDGEQLTIAKRYEVKMGVIDQPAGFAIDIGDTTLAKKLIDAYPPNTPFELAIAGVTMFRGRTDGWTVSGNSGGTQVVLRGRDGLAKLFNAYVTVGKSWEDLSYEQLTRKVLDEVYGAGKYKLDLGGEARRQALAGSNVREQKKSDRFAKSATSKKKLQAKIGQQWYGDLLKPTLDRAGLFLMAGLEEDSFILTTANPAQDPIAKIFRRRGDLQSQVLSYSFRNEPTMRFSRCDVYGRDGGGKEARTKVVGSYIDNEMGEWGVERPFTISDPKCTTLEQAEFLARRKMSELRRQAWALEYTVRGHVTYGYLSRLPQNYVIWAPDCVVHVQDEDLGIDGMHYLESVTFSADPHATTRLRLMRQADVFFGTDE
jgi:prophage tail gpP-like protein